MDHDRENRGTDGTFSLVRSITGNVLSVPSFSQQWVTRAGGAPPLGFGFRVRQPSVGAAPFAVFKGCATGTMKETQDQSSDGAAFPFTHVANTSQTALQQLDFVPGVRDRDPQRHGVVAGPPDKCRQLHWQQPRANQKAESSDILLSHPPNTAEDGAPSFWKSLIKNGELPYVPYWERGGHLPVTQTSESETENHPRIAIRMAAGSMMGRRVRHPARFNRRDCVQSEWRMSIRLPNTAPARNANRDAPDRAADNVLMPPKAKAREDDLAKYCAAWRRATKLRMSTGLLELRGAGSRRQRVLC